MRGFRRFSDFVSSRSPLSRAVLLEDIGPLVHPQDIVSVLDRFGPNIIMSQIHCPTVGAYMRKMLVVMASQEAANQLLLGGRLELPNKTSVTVSRYRKLGKLLQGRFNLYLMTDTCNSQVTLSDVEDVGTDLANKIHNAFQEFRYTSFHLVRDKPPGSEGRYTIYTGVAEVRFEDEKAREQVLKRCRVDLKTIGLWEDKKVKIGRQINPHDWCATAFETFKAEKDKESASGGAATNAIPATEDHKEEPKEDAD